jgi:hypothetical protein
MPICARPRCTEHTHRTSPNERHHAHPIGTSVRVRAPSLHRAAPTARGRFQLLVCLSRRLVVVSEAPDNETVARPSRLLPRVLGASQRPSAPVACTPIGVPVGRARRLRGAIPRGQIAEGHGRRRLRGALAGRVGFRTCPARRKSAVPVPGLLVELTQGRDAGLSYPRARGDRRG